MPAQHISLMIESRLEEVPLLGALVNTLCLSSNLSKLAGNEVEVCIVEAVNNAIRHAYHEEPGDVVEVAVTVLPEEIVFEVFDKGTSADPEIMHADHSDALELDPEHVGEVPEDGRGLAIMHALMDSFEYTPGSARNRLRMTKLRNSPSGQSQTTKPQ
jgi:serine/threonine-protein kinase RsbW